MKKEVGKLLLDLFKIVFAGVFLTYFSDSAVFDKNSILIFAIIFMALFLFTGLLLLKQSEK